MTSHKRWKDVRATHVERAGGEEADDGDIAANA
jgi:hypothetical protein